MASAALVMLSTLVQAEPPRLDARQAQIFGSICARCHVQDVAGVPMLGDESEWSARRAQGFEVLLSHTVTGFKGMPPLGTCSFCSEDDLRQLVAFLAGLTLSDAEQDAKP